MFDFIIKSNELNSETREQIKKILKNDDWVDALILLYKWVLKEDPNLEILGKRGRAVGFYSPYAGQKIFAVNIDENGDIKTGSSLLMKSLDYTFWDALEAVQKSHCQDIEQSDDWTLNHDHYMRLEKGTVPLHDLIDKQVIHKKYGQGRITALYYQTVAVGFEDGGGVKTFVFPDSFIKYMKFTDAALQQYMNEVIN